MPILDDIKRIFFNTPEAKAEFIKRVSTADNKFEDFDAALLHHYLNEKDEFEFQKKLAIFFRNTVIEYLKDSQDVFPRDFRAVYTALKGSAELSAFFVKQQKNFEYTTESEAVALANLFDMTLMVTEERDSAPPATGAEIPVTYYKSTREDAPILHLYYKENPGHWYIETRNPGSTFGDGNCLYHAFAQILRQIVLFEHHTNSTFNKQSIIVGDLPGYTRLYLKQLQALNPGAVSASAIADLIKQIPKNPTIKSADEQMAVAIGISELTDNDMRPFEKALGLLSEKMNSLSLASNYKEAFEVAKALHTKLTTAFEQFKKDKIYAIFESVCMVAIDAAQKSLEPKLGFGEIIANIVCAILGLGVIYAAFAVWHHHETGRWGFFHPDPPDGADEIPFDPLISAAKSEAPSPG
jgi:hypothetical protein